MLAGVCWCLLAAGCWWLFLRRQIPRAARAHGRTHTADALQQSIPLNPAHPNPTQSNPSHSNPIPSNPVPSNPLRPGRSPACGVCLAAGSRQPKAGKRVRRRRTKPAHLPIHQHSVCLVPVPFHLTSPPVFQSIPEAPPQRLLFAPASPQPHSFRAPPSHTHAARAPNCACATTESFLHRRWPQKPPISAAAACLLPCRMCTCTPTSPRCDWPCE
jgi:hypothetical protein